MGEKIKRGRERIGLFLTIATPACLMAIFLLEMFKDPGDPMELTDEAMLCVLHASADFARQNGRFPASLKEVPTVVQGVMTTHRDAWGELLRYRMREDGLLDIQTYGRDRAYGGNGLDFDTRYRAATLKDDGTPQLEGPGGGPLRFLTDWEFTVYEITRGAREVDRRLGLDELEAAFEDVQGVYVIDSWDTQIDVEVREEDLTILLTSLGKDRQRDGADDIVASSRLVDGQWTQWLLDSPEFEDPRPLYEVSREMRGDDS